MDISQQQKKAQCNGTTGSTQIVQGYTKLLQIVNFIADLFLKL